MLIESNKDSKASLNSRSVSSYTITASTGVKGPYHTSSVSGRQPTNHQLSTIVHHTKEDENKMPSYIDTNSFDQLPRPIMPSAL